MTTTTFEAGTERHLLDGLTITLGEVREIRLHPSGTRFDGPAVVVAAWTNTVFGLSDSRGRRVGPVTGAFVRLVSLSDPARREVTELVATVLPEVV